MTSQVIASHQTNQKSRLQKSQFIRTPSTAQMKPQNGRYFENLDISKTDKKRFYPDIGGQVGVLMQQNKQLLTENREMAYTIHDRNKTIDELQRKYNRKVQQLADLMKAVEKQRQRFVTQVLDHKQQTERQLKAFQQEISRLHKQKNQVQIELNRERKRQNEFIEKERKHQVDVLSKNYKQNLELMQNQIDKLKSKLDDQYKRQQLVQIQNKQQVQKLKTQITQAEQQIKHEQHLKRLEIAQTKQFYDQKIQQIHLEHRRHQEIFLTEHQAQIKRLQDEIVILQQQSKKKEEKKQIIQKQIQNTQKVQAEYQRKIQSQVDEVKRLAKEKLIQEKSTLEKLLLAEHEVSRAATIEEISQLKKEIQSLVSLLKTKTLNLNQLYEEYDLLRRQHTIHIQQQAKLITELQQTLYLNQGQKQQQLQVFKIKMAELREADLKGLKEIYQNQIKLLTQKLADKQSVIKNKKQKIHGELADKSQLRERYNIQFAKYKSQIIALNSKINDLQAQIFTADAEKIQMLRQEHQKSLSTERHIQKMDNFRTDELQQLQSIIKAKDTEIEQLENKIQLLRDNQILEADRKQLEINELDQKYSLKITQKEAEIFKLLSELQKIKLVLQTQKIEFQDNISSLNNQHSKEINKMIQEYNQTLSDSNQEITLLRYQNRNLQLEVNMLKKKLEEEVVKAEETYRNIREHHKTIVSKQKQQLQKFYKDKLKQNEESIEQLVQKNNELGSDLIDARENYTQLEKKLEVLIQSQSGLREIQRKVMDIGKQNTKLIAMKSISK